MKVSLISKRLSSLKLGGLILLLGLGVGTLAALPARAEITQQIEAPGQTLYQSQQTVQDQTGNPWEAIALRRVYPDGHDIFHLRLVGTPNSVELSRDQPLTVVTALGQILTATNVSDEIFSNASPAPFIRQYDLQPLLPQLDPTQPLRLGVSTVQESTISLEVPPSVIQEWQEIAGCED